MPSAINLDNCLSSPRDSSAILIIELRKSLGGISGFLCAAVHRSCKVSASGRVEELLGFAFWKSS